MDIQKIIKKYIKKYIEIDEESLEVQLTRGLEAGLEGPALYANIPIKNVKPVAPQNENEDAGGVVEDETETGDVEITSSPNLSSIVLTEEGIVVCDNKVEAEFVFNFKQGDADYKLHEASVGYDNFIINCRYIIFNIFNT